MGIGWLSSIVVHALILVGALWIVDEIQPVPPKVFRWNVTLVEKTRPQSVDVAIPSGSKSTAPSTAEFKPRPAVDNQTLATVERKVIQRRIPSRRSDATITAKVVQLAKPRFGIKKTIRDVVGGATSKVAATTVTRMPVKTAAQWRPSTEPLFKKIDRIESTQRLVERTLGRSPGPASIAKRTRLVDPEPIGSEKSVKRVLDKLATRTQDHGLTSRVSAEATVVTKRVPTSGTGTRELKVPPGLGPKGNPSRSASKVARSARPAKSREMVLRSMKETGLAPSRMGDRPSPIISANSAVVTPGRVARDPGAPQILARRETESTSQALGSEIPQGHNAGGTKGVTMAVAEGKEVDQKTLRDPDWTNKPSFAGKLTARNRSAPKTDYGWLARAMLERVSSVRRYPSAARANNREGKVVLRAVISENGDLVDVSIKQSSGHEVLDQDAMNLVRRVCPVPLDFPLGRPQVVMQIPITYSLR